MIISLLKKICDNGFFIYRFTSQEDFLLMSQIFIEHYLGTRLYTTHEGWNPFNIVFLSLDQCLLQRKHVSI